MYEALPLTAGVVLALIFARYKPSSERMKWIITAVVAVVFGVTATILAGEAWFLVFWDIAQSVFATLLVGWLLSKRASAHTVTQKRNVR